MNHVSALLAFAAIMIVLTTLATVVVEGLHKLTRRRAKDFEALLSRLYDDVIKPRLERELSEKSDLPKAKDFVTELVINPAFGARGWLARWPVTRAFFDTAFDQLTTRQFVEQLAQTQLGNTLATLKDEAAQAIIGTVAYEFERYGDAATHYFRNRATVLSVVVAFVLAIGMNIDAFRLYGALSRDDDLTTRVLANVDIARLEAAYRGRADLPINAGSTVVPAPEKTDVQDGDGSNGTPPAPEQQDSKSSMAASSNGDVTASTTPASPEAVLNEIKREAMALQALGLPVGQAFFPYCIRASGQSAPAPVALDGRCRNLPKTSDYRSTVPFVGGLVSVIGQMVINGYNRIFTKEGIAWLFSVLVTGGLIGLGAPFWFKTFQFIVAFVPGVKLPDGTQSRQPTTGDTSTTTNVIYAKPAGGRVGGLPRYGRVMMFTPGGDDEMGIVRGSDVAEIDVVSPPGLSDRQLYQAFRHSKQKN